MSFFCLYPGMSYHRCYYPPTTPMRNSIVIPVIPSCYTSYTDLIALSTVPIHLLLLYLKTLRNIAVGGELTLMLV